MKVMIFTEDGRLSDCLELDYQDRPDDYMRDHELVILADKLLKAAMDKKGIR